MASGLRLARFGAVLASAAVVALATAMPAAAATRGIVDTGRDNKGVNIHIDGKSVSTQLIGIKLDDGTKTGTTLLTYCVELTVASKNGASVVESQWDKYPSDSGGEFKAKSDKVLWILANSFPTVPVGELSEKVSRDLGKEEAIAGTQAAIWHFSNGAKLTEDPKSDKGDIVALYEYLTGEKNTGIKEEPEVSLEITPDKAEGKAGEKIGAFKVQTTAQKVKLSVQGPQGVQLVNAEGKEVTEGSNGSEFFVLAPTKSAAGQATIKAETPEAVVEKGRIFVGDNVRTQTLITAGSTKTKRSVEAKAKWVAVPQTVPSTTTPSTTTPTTSTTVPSSTTVAPAVVPAPQGKNDLANTGTNYVLPLAIGGLVVLGGGTALVLWSRRRKAGESG